MKMFGREVLRRVVAILVAASMMLLMVPAYALDLGAGTQGADSTVGDDAAETASAENQQIKSLLDALEIKDYDESVLADLTSGALTLEEYTGWSTSELTGRLIDAGVSLSEQQLATLEGGADNILSVLRESKMRLIVELEGESALERTAQPFSASGVMSSATRSAQVSIQAQQEEVEAAIAAQVTDGLDVDVVYHYTLLTNAMAVDATADQMNEIAQLDGVTNVYVDPVYKAIPTDAALDSSVEDTAAFTVYQSGTSTSYTGAGQVIAIIDTGIDTDHEAFANAPADQAITSDTLTAMDVAQLNAYSLLQSADADSFVNSVYLSGKIPFRFNYADESTYVDHDNDSQSDHGTHVAGITAGYAVDAEGAVTFAGTAPNAQLVIMKVFGANRAGQWSDILAALEDCVVLQVDVINMSLGSVSGFSDFADTYTGDTSGTNKVFANLESAGIVVCCAAGNDYTSAYGNSFGNNLALASNPDNSILSKPGSITSTLAVASAASEVYFGNSVQITTGDGVTHKIAYTNNYTSESRNILKFKGETKGLVVLQSANGTLLTGTATDFDTYCANGELTGKFVAVKRGQVFTETASLAEKYGAIGLIVYDHSAGSLSTMSENTAVSIPAIFISKADGEILCDYYAAAGADAVITVSASEEKIQNADFGSINDFSSQGVTNDLKLKPEITGLGGMVYSATGDGSYGLKSGTSMATPYIAGVTAALKQALEARYSNNSAQVTKQLVTELLMSTAVPLTQSNNGGVLYSPRRQGAGLANLAAAVASPVYLDADGAAKLDLGDRDNTGAFGTDGKTLTMTFNVMRTGASSDTLTYAVDVTALTEAILKNQSADRLTTYWNKEAGKYETITVTRDFMSGKAYELAADFTVSGDGVSAADAGYTLTLGADMNAVPLTVTVTLSDTALAYLEQYENGIYVDGYVFLNSLDEGGVDLSIPFLSFYGNWVTVPVFDEGTWVDELTLNPQVDAAVAGGMSLADAIARYAPVSAFDVSSIGTYYKFWGYLYPLGTKAGYYNTAQDWYGSRPSELGNYTVNYTGEDALQYTQDYNVINQYPITQSYFNNASSISHNELSTTRALDKLYQQVWYFPDWTGTQTELYDAYMSLSTQEAREAWLAENGTLAYNHTSENLRKSYYYSSSVGVLPTGYFSNEDSMDWFAGIYPSDENGQSTCTWSSGSASNNYPSNVEWLPDGAQCLVVLTATPDYAGLNATDESVAQAKYQNTIAAPVRVDNSAPDLKDLKMEFVQDEDGTEHMYYSVRVKDGGAVEAISLNIGGSYKAMTVHAYINIPVPCGAKYQDEEGYIPVQIDLLSDGIYSEFAPYALGDWDAIHYLSTLAEDFGSNEYLTYNGEKPETKEDRISFRPYAAVSVVTNTKVLSQSRSLQMTATGTVDATNYPSLYPDNADIAGLSDSIQYVSLNPEYATVTKDGLVTAVNTGDSETHVATIRAYSATFPRVYQDFKLTVTPYMLQKQVDEADAETGLRYQGGDVTETITIEKDVIIDMGGATITSIAGSPAFNIDNGATVTLRNATIVADSEQYADDVELLEAFLGEAPSAIRVLNGNLLLEQCLVYGSKTTVDGQELYTGSAVELMDGSTLTVKKSELHGIYAVNNAVNGYVKGGLITIEDGTFFGSAAAVKDYVTAETVTYPEGTSAYDTNAYYTGALTQGAVSTGFELAAPTVTNDWGGVTFTPEELLNDWTPVNCNMTMNDDGSLRVTLNAASAYLYCSLPEDKQFVGSASSVFGGSTRVCNSDGSTTQRRLDVYWSATGTTFGYIWLREAQGVGQTDLKTWTSLNSNAKGSTWNGQTINYLKIVFNNNFVAGDYVDIGYFTVYPTAWSSYGGGVDTVHASTTVLTAVKDASASTSTSGTRVYISPDENNLVSDSLTKADPSFYSRFGYRWVPTSVTLADGTETPLATDESGGYYFEPTDEQDFTANFTLQSVLSEEEKAALVTACADTDTAKTFLETFVTQRLGRALGLDQLESWVDRITEMLACLQDGLIARDAMHWDTPYGEAAYNANVNNGTFSTDNTGLPFDPYFLGSPAYGDVVAPNSTNDVGPMWGIPISGTFYTSASKTAAITNTCAYTYKATNVANVLGAKEKFLTSALNKYQSTVDQISGCSTLAEELAWLSGNYGAILTSVDALMGVVKYNDAGNTVASSAQYSGKDACYYDYINYSSTGLSDWLVRRGIKQADVEASYGTKYNPGKNWIGEEVENYNPFEDETLLAWLVEKGIKEEGEPLREFDSTEYYQLCGNIVNWCQDTATRLSKLSQALNATPVNTVVSNLETTHSATYLNAVSDADNVYSVVGGRIAQDGDLWYLSSMDSGSGTSLAEFQFTASFQLGSYVLKSAKYKAGEIILDPMAGEVDPIYTYAWYLDAERTIPVTFDENLVMPMSNVVFYGTATSKLDEDIARVEEGGAFTLEQNYNDLSFTTYIDKDMTLVTNGYSVNTSGTYVPVFTVTDGATLTIKDSSVSRMICVEEGAALVLDNSSLLSSEYAYAVSGSGTVKFLSGSAAAGVTAAIAPTVGIDPENQPFGYLDNMDGAYYDDLITDEERTFLKSLKGDSLYDEHILFYADADVTDTLYGLDDGTALQLFGQPAASGGNFTATASAVNGTAVTDSGDGYTVAVGSMGQKNAELTVEYAVSGNQWTAEFGSFAADLGLRLAATSKQQLAAWDEVEANAQEKLGTMLDAIETYEGNSYVKMFVSDEVASMKAYAAALQAELDAYESVEGDAERLIAYYALVQKTDFTVPGYYTGTFAGAFASLSSQIESFDSLVQTYAMILEVSVDSSGRIPAAGTAMALCLKAINECADAPLLNITVEQAEKLMAVDTTSATHGVTDGGAITVNTEKTVTLYPLTILNDSMSGSQYGPTRYYQQGTDLAAALADVSREDYNLTTWMDALEQPFAAGNLPAMPAEALTLIAAWTLEVKYTVTWVDSAGTALQSARVKEGTDLSTLTAPEAPEKAATESVTYTFTGWSAESGAVTADLTVTPVYSAVYTPQTSGGDEEEPEVQASVEGTLSQALLADENITEVAVEAQVKHSGETEGKTVVTAFDADALRNLAEKLKEVTEGVIQLTVTAVENSDSEPLLKLEQKLALTADAVIYDLSLTLNDEAVTFNDGETGSAKVSLPFSGDAEGKTVYYVSENGDKEVMDAVYQDGFFTFETTHFSTYAIDEIEDTSSETNVTVWVYHRLQKLNEPESFTAPSTSFLDQLSLPAGTIFTPEVRALEGFTAPETQTVTVAEPEGDNKKMKIYYDYTRNSYSLTYTVDGEPYGDAQTYLYEAPITALAEPSKEGYTFSGWTWSTGDAPETMPAADVTVEGSFTINTYAVTYQINGAAVYTEFYDYNSSVSMPKLYSGNAAVEWDQTLSVMPAEDVTVSASVDLPVTEEKTFEDESTRVVPTDDYVFTLLFADKAIVYAPDFTVDGHTWTAKTLKIEDDSYDFSSRSIEVAGAYTSLASEVTYAVTILEVDETNETLMSKLSTMASIHPQLMSDSDTMLNFLSDTNFRNALDQQVTKERMEQFLAEVKEIRSLMTCFRKDSTASSEEKLEQLINQYDRYQELLLSITDVMDQIYTKLYEGDNYSKVNILYPDQLAAFLEVRLRTISAANQIGSAAPAETDYSSYHSYTTTVQGMTETAENKLQLSQFTDLTKSAVTVVVDGLDFTVTSSEACVVAYTADGGETYTRMTATATGEESTYDFSAPGADVTFAVALVGDLDQSGEVDGTDAKQLQRFEAGQLQLNALQMIVVDVNKDGEVDSTDAKQIQRVEAGYGTFDW